MSLSFFREVASGKHGSNVFWRWFDRDWLPTFFLQAVCAHGRASVAGVDSGTVVLGLSGGDDPSRGIDSVGFKARTAARLLGGFFLLSVVLLHIPANGMAGVARLGGWTGAFKALSLAGCALMVAGTFPETEAGSGRRTLLGRLDKLIPLGMYPFATGVIAFGVDHFLSTSYVATLVPAWIPGHIFWTHFAGTPLIASGVGMIVRVGARLAATLLGTMIFIGVLVLHIPRAVADPYSDIGNEWTSTFEALAKSGVAFILGQTLGGERAEADCEEWLVGAECLIRSCRGSRKFAATPPDSRAAEQIRNKRSSAGRQTCKPKTRA